MDQFDSYSTFDDFLDNTMSDIESAEFEKRLTQDEGLMEEFTNYRAANKMGEAYSLLQVRQQLQSDLNSGYADKQIKKRKALKVILPLVIVICGLMSIPFFLTDPKTNGKTPPSDDNTVERSQSIIELSKPSIRETQVETQNTQKKTINQSTRPKTTIEATQPLSQELILDSVAGKPIIAYGDITTSIDENPTTVQSKNPCENFNPPVTIKLSPSESDLDNGEILFLDGTNQLQVSVGNSIFKSPKKGKVLFTNLSPGEHIIRIKNDNGCLKNSTTIIEHIPGNSSDDSEKALEIAFRPDFGEVFSLPIENNESGRLTIRNSTGAILDEIEISEGFPNTWNGESVNFEPGLYVFLLTLDDNKSIQGTVRIY